MKRTNKKKIQPNVVADAIIIAGLLVGCVATFRTPNKSSNNDVYNAEAEEVVVAKMTTTTASNTDSLQEYSVPGGNTSFKSYMDYRCITNTRSPQYKLQNDCWTDENGLRRYGDDYVIAVGSYYADCIGERLDITLDSGEEFTAVVGDFKSDNHTDNTHRYTAMSNGGKNVIEFVVDVSNLDRTARKMGDISYVAGFEGDIESICGCEETKTQKV